MSSVWLRHRRAPSATSQDCLRQVHSPFSIGRFSLGLRLHPLGFLQRQDGATADSAAHALTILRGMRHTPRSSKHWKVGARAIATYLAGRTQPVMLYSLTSVADAAAREAGRVSDLFESLWSYESMLPAGWKGAWLGNDSGEDSIYHAIPAGWIKGPVQPSLSATLMGAREVGIVDSPDT